MNNRKIPFIIRIFVFLVVFALLFERLSVLVKVCGRDSDNPDVRNSLFFYLPKNSVDCLFVGTSHVFCSYDPVYIFKYNGISSAGIATSSQSYQNSYWLIKEALRSQNPKVVVMDIHSVTTPADQSVQDFRLHATSGITIMPDLSLNKLIAYFDIKKNQDGWAKQMSIYDAIGFLEYRNDYNRKNFSLKGLWGLLVNPVSEYQNFGYYPSDNVEPMEELVPTVQSGEVMDFYQTKEFEYLNKIRELLEKEGISLVLTRAPYTRPQLDDMHLYDQALEWIEREQIAYIDFFELLDALEIDLTTDFRDEDHLNSNGAVKVSRYLANYLKQNYDLQDHTNDTKCKVWQKAIKNY